MEKGVACSTQRAAKLCFAAQQEKAKRSELEKRSAARSEAEGFAPQQAKRDERASHANSEGLLRSPEQCGRAGIL